MESVAPETNVTSPQQQSQVTSSSPDSTIVAASSADIASPSSKLVETELPERNDEKMSSSHVKEDAPALTMEQQLVENRENIPKDNKPISYAEMARRSRAAAALTKALRDVNDDSEVMESVELAPSN